MPARQTVAVNPQLLAWAREESGFPLERVSRKFKRFEAWERGEVQPTVRQVEALAHFFHRPLSIFFLPKPPEVPKLATEYRRLLGVQPGHESPELRLALRQMIIRRETALNLFGELGEDVSPFALAAHLRESLADVGARLRAALSVTMNQQLAWPDEWKAWNSWRAAVEELGVLVFQFSKVPLSEVRGLSLLRMPLPVVAINSKEFAPGARLYTLLHEVVHLMLASGNEEQPAIKEHRSGEDWAGVERFAEIAASHALIPEPALQAEVEAASLKNSGWGLDDIRGLARRFRVTPLALATRLRESGFITWNRYRAWREEWDMYLASLPPRKSGPVPQAVKAVGRNGRPFTQLVFEAMSANRITSVDAARYLGLKFQHFEKLRTLLWSGPVGLPSDE